MIFEKNHEVGGTWFENTYPGCRVDVPLFSYSFLQTISIGRSPSPRRTPCSTTSEAASIGSRCGAVSGSAPRCCEPTSTKRPSDGSPHPRTTTRRPTPSTGGLGRGAAQPAEPPGHRWTPPLRRRLVPLCSVAPRHRPHRQARRHHRHWQVPPSSSTGGDTGERAHGLPAHATVDPARPRLPRRASRWSRWVLRHVPDYVRWDRLWLFWRTHEGLLPMAQVDDDRGPSTTSR